MNVNNLEPAEVDITVTKGDTIAISLSILLNTAPHILTNMVVTMMIRRRDGTLLKSLTSEGVAPELLIAGNVLSIYSGGIIEKGTFYYDIQTVEVGDTLTILMGKIIVQDDITV